MYTLTIPMPFKSQAVKRKSDQLMSLNVYRNLHGKSLSNFKHKYADKLKAIITAANIPSQTGITLHYTLHTQPTKGKPIKSNPYRGSKPRNLDLTNMTSIVDKVFSDCLTELNIIPDDTIEFVHRVSSSSEPWSTADYLTVTITPSTLQPDPRLKELT